ncbi:LuxR C-terminal-related transcriptional regulator [Phytoactinopolyspora halotolerans]|uniref:AAA family ATPase n=1 Tax=Phytoactinopolyspora halotolerans TaxID=1981512 RepID=A0A6L9SDG2_9ACTN|nr:LuxR family transcriptional regulator [Phytoactinopolyspora halotolerans]NEE03296.1 AAA family ATPase [Phytoactinopolyspora halotolerans]
MRTGRSGEWNGNAWTAGIIGHELERTRLRDLVAALAEGVGGAILVSGRAGTGKSELVRYVQAFASARPAPKDSGITLAHVVGAESERAWAYSGLHLVLSGVIGALDVERLRQMAPRVDALLARLNDQSASYDVARQVQGLIAGVDTPMLLTVDDAHLLDVWSQEVLGFVARRLRSVPVLMLVTADGSEDMAPFNGLAAVTLDDLSPSDAIRLIHRAVGPHVSSRAAESIVERVGGNPGALLDVVHRIPHDQLTGSVPLDRHLPRSPVLLAHRRHELDGLEPAQRHALLLAEASEDRTLAPVLSALREHGETLATWLLDEHVVEADGDHYALRRPVTASVVWQEATFSERSRAHQALAAAYGERDPDQRLWHLAQLLHHGDAEHAADLQHAAERAVVRGELARALSFAREAVRLTDEVSARVERLLLLGRLCLLSGCFGEVIGIAQERFRLDTTAPQRADLALLEARARCLLDGDVAAGLITRHAEELADDDPNRAARLNLFAVSAYARRLEQAEADRFLAVAERYAAYFDGATHRMYRRASACLASISGDLGRALDLIDDDMVASDVFSEAEQRICRAWVLTRAERFDAARSLLVAVTRDRRLRDSPLLMGEAYAALAVLETHAGRPVAARDAGTQGRRLGAGGVSSAVLSAHMVRTHALLGDEEAAWERHREAAERARRHSDGWITAALQAEAGSVLLLAGRYEESVATLERARRVALEHSDPSILAVEPDYIEACVHAGDLDRAEDALAEYEGRVLKTPTVWAQHTLARCRALVAEGEESVELFKVALETGVEDTSPVEVARTMLCLGDRLRRMRHRAESAGWLRRARVLAQECGAAALAELADRELYASGHHSSPSEVTWDAYEDRLTPAERRVSELVAAGRRNREIATDLYVSVRTVEAHLSRIYRKVGVRSRAELASLVSMARDELDDRRRPGD